jgi:phosphoglycolate phosphatase-like HAD superfamily hydrolase
LSINDRTLFVRKFIISSIITHESCAIVEPMNKVVIFDFDGTIADSLALALEMANKILPQFGWPSGLSETDVNSLRSMTIPQGLKYLKIPAYKLPKLAIVTKREFSEQIDRLKPVEGIVESLKKLSESGVEMGIVTSNSRKNVMSFLRKNDLKHYFSFVEAGASILGKSQNIKSTMRKQRVDSANCVYVGDEIRDIEASQAIGIDCISVSWGVNSRDSLVSRNPDSIVDKPSQLVSMVLG